MFAAFQFRPFVEDVEVVGIVVYVFVRRPIAESRFRAGFVFQLVAEQIGTVRCVVSYGELSFKPVSVLAVVS